MTKLGRFNSYKHLIDAVLGFRGICMLIWRARSTIFHKVSVAGRPIGRIKIILLDGAARLGSLEHFADLFQLLLVQLVHDV